MTRYASILDTIGNTPMVRLNHMAPEGVNLYVKVESFNPMGSVKDRMAAAIIEDAEARGELKPGQTVIEATSGNTGIGLAMVCAQKGYPLVVTMAENFSIERRKMLRFLGARVVLTPASEKGTGMLNKAIELAEKHGYFLCRQFENEANAAVHTRTTAQEIMQDMGDDPLHYFVTGFGTGGTLKGTARGLRAGSPDTKIIAAEPDNSPVLGSGIAQPRDAKGKATGSHPHFRPHLMQGWSPDFISQLTEEAVAADYVDEIMPVAGDDAMATSRALAQREGIFVGTSSGATLAAALSVARRSQPGTNIVAMLPDTGERYMSTPLFADISEDMTDEERALSMSTAGYRFDPGAPPPPPSTDASDEEEAVHDTPSENGNADIALDDEALALVANMTQDKPVVMFALEWCEFCWSVRKFFDKAGIEYTSVDLDSVAYQAGDMGGKVRAVLAEQTGAPTIPQIYVGGEHVGGCTELFDAYKAGELEDAMDAADIPYQKLDGFDPYGMLPNWLHTRG